MHEDNACMKAAYCDFVRPITSDLGMLRDHKSGTEGFSLRGIYKVMHIRKQERQSSNHWAILGGLLLLGTLWAGSKSALLVYYSSCTMRAGSVHINQTVTDTVTFKVALLKRAPGHRLRSAGDKSSRGKRYVQILEQTSVLLSVYLQPS